ncbi:hypothetical protein G7K_1821-t1 [Saitoella complicata NRRL Y-17804]|uniref:Uncharacterized protein n=2 Tax=Saitoella complicata (strain BCRC 22490 / CBS 7301 / JCM 7358 / NBRC 10748 / NRRL Y-17804) TaxID=698492 RepID=A0A0E9ND35_SAICN|nr:hypothetical protein G7K_1821-t1 [Saitoella complicata NRRL Y-17804]
MAAPADSCSITARAREIFASLFPLLPAEAGPFAEFVTITTSDARDGEPSHDFPYLPCPFPETELASALKALEATMCLLIASDRFGSEKERKAIIETERASLFLLMTYVSTVGRRNKHHPQVREFLKDTDLHRAQSNIYRRLSANIYPTKDGRYFHLHGSLLSDPSLGMVGLPPYKEELTAYGDVVKVIGDAVKKFTAAELEKGAEERKQAGAICLTMGEWAETEQGRIAHSLPPYVLEPVPAASSSGPTPWPQTDSDKLLSGIKVLELCRIIAGPTIGRTLASYGASVLKITSPNLSDVPFFQVDGNAGKRCAELDLKSAEGRKVFEELVKEADVVVDGYRLGALDRLGYGPEGLGRLLEGRGRGFVYVRENCYGHVGPWAERAGWQQIADVSTGVAIAMGKALGLEGNEPVVPPFPMSDYGTGSLGTIAVLHGLWNRKVHGGNWVGSTSLAAYDTLLTKQGEYPPAVLDKLFDAHKALGLELVCTDNVDVVSKKSLKTLKELAPFLFDEGYLIEVPGYGFGTKEARASGRRDVVEECKVVKGTVEFVGVETNGEFEEGTRVNGWDEARWW